ncbi:MAG: 23S rRNA (adenine(2503)-C(2))-methyltransferase RlmN [Planctomycetota bacterium]
MTGDAPDDAAARAPGSLLAASPEELRAFVVARGGQPFHAKVLRRAVVERGVTDVESITDLPARLRARVAADLPLFSGRETARNVARDGTTNLHREFEGRARSDDATSPVSVETVHIQPHERASSDGAARGATLCVSTQAGCPVGCPFCASGLLGLARNLEHDEIVEQFVRGREVGPLSRAVVMGIGEPLLNYENLSRALDVVRDEIGLGGRRITVSTVGFPERLRRIAPSKPRFQLAISLHTPDQEQRDELVPAMRGVPIESVLEAGDDWFRTTGREVTYEYVLLGGTNDAPGHADRLVQRLRGRRCSVNLIPYNPTRGLPYERPDSGAPEAFRDRLVAGGLVATIRWSRGLDGAAACGQLRLQRS